MTSVGAGPQVIVRLESFNDRCQNVQGPSPMLVYLKVARRDMPGSPAPNLPGTWTPDPKRTSR